MLQLIKALKPENFEKECLAMKSELINLNERRKNIFQKANACLEGSDEYWSIINHLQPIIKEEIKIIEKVSSFFKKLRYERYITIIKKYFHSHYDSKINFELERVLSLISNLDPLVEEYKVILEGQITKIKKKDLKWFKQSLNYVNSLIVKNQVIYSKFYEPTKEEMDQRISIALEKNFGKLDLSDIVMCVLSTGIMVSLFFAMNGL